MRAVELRLEGRALVAAVARRALAGDVGEEPARIHFQETVAAHHLDDEHLARRVELRAERLEQLGACGRDAGAVFVTAGDQDDFFGPGCDGDEDEREDQTANGGELHGVNRGEEAFTTKPTKRTKKPEWREHPARGNRKIVPVPPVGKMPTPLWKACFFFQFHGSVGRSGASILHA